MKKSVFLMSIFVILGVTALCGCFGIGVDKDKECTHFSPAPQVTKNIGTEEVDCFVPMEIKGHTNWCLYMRNIGENNITDASVLVSPDGKAPWAPLVWTNCDHLMPGDACLYKEENSAWNYMKVMCRAEDNMKTDISVAYSGNNCCKQMPCCK